MLIFVGAGIQRPVQPGGIRRGLDHRSRDERGQSGRDCASYTAAQVLGTILGTVLANAMSRSRPLEVSLKVRATPGQWLGEVVAAAGLTALILALILALARSGRVRPSAAAVSAPTVPPPSTQTGCSGRADRESLTGLAGPLVTRRRERLAELKEDIAG